MLTSSHGIDDFTYNSSEKNPAVMLQLVVHCFVMSSSFDPSVTCNDNYTIRHATESLNIIKRIQNRSCITYVHTAATCGANSKCILNFAHLFLWCALARAVQNYNTATQQGHLLFLCS